MRPSNRNYEQCPQRQLRTGYASSLTYGSVIEDSLIAQQKEAGRRLREIQALRAKQKVSKFA